MNNQVIDKPDILSSMQEETEKIVNFYEEFIEKTNLEMEAKDSLIKSLKTQNASLRKTITGVLSMLYQAMGKGFH